MGSASIRYAVKVIELKPCRGGWKVFEMPGVEPVFIGPDSQPQALDYAKTRQGFSKGEIRLLNSAGEIVATIQFDDERKEL